MSKLAAEPELRQTVGLAARAEVSKWDWKAATQHLLQQQYPLAVAAAAAVYGAKLGSFAAAAVSNDSGTHEDMNASAASATAGAASQMPA